MEVGPRVSGSVVPLLGGQCEREGDVVGEAAGEAGEEGGALRANLYAHVERCYIDLPILMNTH